MILSDFVMTRVQGRGPLDWVYFADVCVVTETGALWWKRKKTERRQICREFAGSWHFVDDGHFCPGHQAEALERSYKAQEALKKP